jgi:hypothetical protein
MRMVQWMECLQIAAGKCDVAGAVMVQQPKKKIEHSYLDESASHRLSLQQQRNYFQGGQISNATQPSVGMIRNPIDLSLNCGPHPPIRE